MPAVRNAQVWQCAVCGEEYRPVIPATAVYCSRVHRGPKGRGRSGHLLMTLVEGSPVPNRKKKESPRGKSGSL